MSERTGSARRIERCAGPVVVGSPAERARAVLGAFPERTAALAAAVGSVDDEPAGDELTAWVARCYELLARTFPEVTEFLVATADALGVDVMTLFTRSHRRFAVHGVAVLPGPAADEGCSTAGGLHAEAAAWLVKNRDNNRETLERQIVVEHVDPSWAGRRVIAVANLGGCMANSSGINSAGFAAVDTAVPVAHTPPGIFRAFLLDGLLGRCSTVDEALDIVASVQHMGGTLTIADASGAVASVDLHPDGPVVERVGPSGTVCRTNHVFAPDGGARRGPEPDAARADSEARLGTIGAFVEELPQAPLPWDEFRSWLCDRMLVHDVPGALCKHDPAGSLTLGTTVYGCTPPTMLTSLGPGCTSRWVEWTA